MLFTCAKDFFDKASNIERISRQQEKELYSLIKAGDTTARDKMVESYLFIVASRIKRLPNDIHSIDLIYSCVDKLEKEVDKFDFSNDGETFTHRLTLIIQKEITNHIAKN